MVFLNLSNMMLKKLCFRKVFTLNPSVLFLRESSDLKGRINLPGAPMSPSFLYARGARQGSVEGPDMWNQVLDNALREPAGRWETEGMLARDYRKAHQKRRGSSGDAVKEEGQVLHHLCWADDLYAMAGTMNHLTRILEDMTNAIERLGMGGKKKVLPLLLGRSPSTNLAMLLRLSATVAYVGFGEWWKAWRHWERGWTIVVVQRPTCGTGSPKQTPCFTQRRLCSVIPNCQ